MKNSDKKNTNKSEQHSLIKTIAIIFILVIIVFILLTSCTSDFFGKIGTLFENFSEYIFKENDKNLMKVYNKELKFITDSSEIETDDIYKLEFTYEDIKPTEISCITSKADIATCIVKDNYVEVYPKTSGKVTISVITKINGKEYIGTHKLSINEIERKISLSTNSKTIYLTEGNNYRFSYELINIEGKVESFVENDKILSAHIKNNTLVVTPKKVGSTTVTIQVEYKGKKYTDTLKITIKEKREEIIKSSENRLDKINISGGNIQPNFNSDILNYEINVSSSTSMIDMSIIKKDDKSKVYYYLNDSKINSLNNIKLNYDKNVLIIVVQAEDNTIKKYTFKINKDIAEPIIKSDVNTLNNISGIDINFNKDVLNYNVEVKTEALNLNVDKTDSKSTVEYYVDNVKYNNLNNITITLDNTKTIKIKVISESGKERIYTLNVTRKSDDAYIKSDINTLDNIIGIDINFNKDVLNYNVEVKVDTLNLNVSKTDNKSTVEYYIDNVKYNNLNNINITSGSTKTIRIKVISESGKERIYTLNVTRKSDDAYIKSDINTLDNIIGIDINFNKDVLNYNVEVKVDTLNLNVSKTDSKSTVEYYIDNVKYNNLNNINITSGSTKTIKIKVTSESGKERIYTLNVTKIYIESDVNTLNKLTIKDYNLNFDKNVNDYTLIVEYNTTNINLSYELTDKKSSISFKLNSSELLNNDIELKEGINKLEIIVISESGLSNIYTLTIKKPIRKVVLDKSKTTINIEDGDTDFIYEVYEDRNIDNNFILINDYDINDINISIENFKGKYEINKGYITLKLANEDINNTYELNINYLNKKDKTNFKVIMNNYYVDTVKDTYNFDYYNNNFVSIILNTNIFNNDISVKNITNGIKLYNDKGYINITSSNLDILKLINDIENDNSNYISFKSQLLNGGTVTININGNVYGKNIANKNITLNITKKYSVTIDANGGNFNSFTTSYNYLKEENETINLSEYVPYKVDKTGNCLYYILQSYNTKPDGTGTVVDKNEVININSDIVLYAIYTADSQYMEIEEENTIYLTDVDLFHNEEYYNYYNIDKIIYPTAKGSHVMYLENNLDSTIKINKIHLKETTTCISTGCINMGYIIKYTKPSEDNWNYIYGDERDYQILNLDPNVVKNVNGSYENTISIETNEITLNPGESTTISLLWQWVDIDDTLDTDIGKIATEEYSILVSLDYTTTNSYCNIN